MGLQYKTQGSLILSIDLITDHPLGKFLSPNFPSLYFYRAKHHNLVNGMDF